jgi:hypothetical protein
MGAQCSAGRLLTYLECGSRSSLISTKNLIIIPSCDKFTAINFPQSLSTRVGASFFTELFTNFHRIFTGVSDVRQECSSSLAIEGVHAGDVGGVLGNRDKSGG